MYTAPDSWYAIVEVEVDENAAPADKFIRVIVYWIDGWSFQWMSNDPTKWPSQRISFSDAGAQSKKFGKIIFIGCKLFLLCLLLYYFNFPSSARWLAPRVAQTDRLGHDRTLQQVQLHLLFGSPRARVSSCTSSRKYAENHRQDWQRSSTHKR